MSVVFIWWNLLFPYIDFVYTAVFLPGVVLAFFGVYWIAGPMTLVVLPLAMLINYVMYTVQVQMFRSQGLKVRRNLLGFVIYALLYGAILQPACLAGYFMEFFKVQKRWGTK
jgi:biofilm PGA synthesis N-glycosyltransferase PgaC